MRKIIVAGVFAMLPIVSNAATPTAVDEPTPGYSFTDVVLISAGAIAGAVLVDFIISKTFTTPIEVVAASAIAEASAAGAVFGDQIAAATAVKDAAARADMLYALFIGSGAVLGALAIDQIWSWTTTIDSKTSTK